MKLKGMLFLLAVLVSLPAMADDSRAIRISGDYMEFRTADVFTGPCFANGEVGLTGQEAVLAWRIREGSWNDVALDGLSVAAVIRARATLGDPYSNPLPAQAVLIVDERATEAQRAALVSFVQQQTNGLVNRIVAVESAPIRVTVGEGERQVFATLEAGNLLRLATRAITSADHICRNEDVFYQPLAANLHHATPAVATESTYRGNHLGVTWTESGRRSSFVGAFAF